MLTTNSRLLSILLQRQQAAICMKPVRFLSTSDSREESATETASSGAGPLPQYTQAECTKILQIINNSSPTELLSYDISKARANKLLAWQSRNGSLKDVQDILCVDGFNLKIIEKFYKSLLEISDTNLGKKTVRPRTAPFITPAMDVEQTLAIQSCVSVRVAIDSVTWARIELPSSSSPELSPCLLTHWQHHVFAEKKLHLHELIHSCLYVNSLIPAADCYVFENPQMAQATNLGSVDQQNVNIQRAQVTAIMGYALSARGYVQAAADTTKKRAPPPSVFYLRRFLTARLFNYIVGTERVSSEDAVTNLMRTYYNTENQVDFLQQEEHTGHNGTFSEDANRRLSFRGNVQFPSDLRSLFFRAERVQREFLGQTLLLNMAFMRLVLLQDPQSIASVTRNTRKSDQSKI